MRQCRARVLALQEVNREFYSLILHEPYLAATVQPGQFLHLRVDSGLSPLLRRPFSVAGAFPGTGTVRLLFRCVGEGTKLLCRVREGDLLDCLGPLGTPFTPAGADPAVLLAGGTGIAPLLYLAESLLAAGRGVHLFYGATGAAALLPLERFLSPGLLIHYATEDGTAGEQGLLPDVFQRALDNGLLPGELFACGPRPFLAALARGNQRWRFPLQISLEERMACGIGACQGCAVLIQKDGVTAYARVCREGPVFRSEEVVW
ncbi:MAG: dihydroorotate dehydrogenase electron transfer subunit [Bacillota bacterium]